MFADRRSAGRRLAIEVAGLGLHDPVVVAIPRGGIVVGAQVAWLLGAPLHVIGVRKLPCPWSPTIGMGAVAEGGVRLVNDVVVDRHGIEPHDVAYAVQAERRNLEADIRRFRGAAPRVRVGGRAVVVVDDGMVSGYSMRAGITALRAAGANRVIAAAPIAADGAIAEIAGLADRVVVVSRTERLERVTSAYHQDAEISDAALDELLRPAPRRERERSRVR